MRKHCQLAIILSAWFMATGAQWDLVQVFGWARMAVNYSRTMPLLSAVQRTFDGEMCGVCRAVNEAKNQGKDATVPQEKIGPKMVFVMQPVPVFVAPVAKDQPWPLAVSVVNDAWRGAPPTPPPRA